MATIGPLIVEPGTGSYCWVTLDSGEQILVNHDTEGAETGCITIEASKAFEFSSDPLFEFDLDSLAARGESHCDEPAAASANGGKPAGRPVARMVRSEVPSHDTASASTKYGRRWP